MDIGKRIRETREKKGIQQLELANKVNISQSKMNKIETGFQKKLEPELINDIAIALRVSTDYLLGREENIVSVAGKEIELTRDELRIFEELKKHPIIFHDLATDPEKKVKELIKLYKMKKMFLDEEDETEELGDGFGEIED